MLCILSSAGCSFLPASPDEEAAALRREVTDGLEITGTVQGRVVRTEWTGDGRKVLLDHLTIRPDGTGRSETAVQENPKIRLLVNLPEDPDLRRGQRVRLHGTLSCAPLPSNPGQYDSRSHDFAGNVLYRMKKTSVPEVSGTPSPLAFSDRLRENAARILCTAAGDDAGTIRAMLLGDRSDLEKDVRRAFSDSGIIHILAVSGLHISIFGMGLFRFLRNRSASFGACFLLSGMTVMLYCFMTGMSVSASRAMVMYLVWAGSQLLGRTNDPLTSSATAAVVVLAWRPGNVKEAGFYLSFGCILSITLICPPVTQCVSNILKHVHAKRLPRLPAETLGIPAGILLGTLPISGWFFYQFSPWSVLTNLLVIPLMPLVMLSGLAAAVAGILSPAAGVLLFAPCHYLLALFERAAGFMNRLPGAPFIIGRPAWWKIPLYYLLLVFGLRLAAGSPVKPAAAGARKAASAESTKAAQKPAAGKKAEAGNHRTSGNGEQPSGKHLAGGLLCAAAAVLLLCVRMPPAFQITFLDVGQGDCILLQASGRTFLVDCGSSSVPEVWSNRVENTLKYYGIRTLDQIFLTHADLDHTNGIVQMLESGQRTLTGSFRCSGIRVCRVCTARDAARYDEGLREVLSLAHSRGIPVSEISQGGRILCGSLHMECLWPGSVSGNGPMSAKDWERLAGNETSLVLLVECGRLRILLTGDLEKEGEERFLEYWSSRSFEAAAHPAEPEPAADPVTLLKVGHHGSRMATSTRMLELFRPAAALISCGRNNVYGHPSEDVLERLRNAGCRVWRTDRDGALVVRFRHGAPFISYVDPR